MNSNAESSTSSNSGPAWTNKPKKKLNLNKNQINSNLNNQLNSNSNTNEQIIEAPYLNHNIRFHGVYTLSPPDNMGRRRQPGELDPSPSNSTSSLSLPSNSVYTTNNKKSKETKKKKTKKKLLSVDPEILSAVENVGRTPSPQPLISSTSASTSSSSISLNRPNIDRNHSSLNSIISSISSTSSTNTEEILNNNRRDLGEGTSSRMERLYSDRDDLFEYTEDHNQEQSQLPAFPFPSSTSSTLPTMTTFDSIHPSDTTFSFDPPPAYPSPSPSPTISSNPLPLPNSNNYTNNEPEDSAAEEEEEEEEEEEFIFHPLDPFVVAWETDRISGLSLDERITRDLLRRKNSLSNLVQHTTSSSSHDVSSTISYPLVSSTNESEVSIPVLEEEEEEEEDLVSPQIRREIEVGELTQDGPRVARALSMLSNNNRNRSRRNSITSGRGRSRRSTITSRVQEENIVEDVQVVNEEVTPKKKVVEEEVVEIESESDEEISRPARLPSMNAGARFAAAAERRLKLAQLDNERIQLLNDSSVSVEDLKPDESPLIPNSSKEVLAAPSSSSIPLSPPPIPPSKKNSTSSSRTMNELRAIYESSSSSSPLSPPLPRRPPPPPPPPSISTSSSSTSTLFSSNSPLPGAQLRRHGAVTQRYYDAPTQPSILPTSISASSSSANSSTSTSTSDPNSMLNQIPSSESILLINPIIPNSNPATSISTSTSTSTNSTIPTLLEEPNHETQSLNLTQSSRPLPIPPTTLSTRVSAYDVINRIQSSSQQNIIVEEENSSIRGIHSHLLTVPSTSSTTTNTSTNTNTNILLNEDEIESRNLSTRFSFEVIREVSIEGNNNEGNNEAEEVVPVGMGGDDFAYTDLDLLLARLEDRARDGTNYDELMLVGEVLGSVIPPPTSSLEDIESLNIAKVELERRRIDKQGKIKSKLSIVGLRCSDCSICLIRFREGNWAVVLPRCLHVFHADCIRSWLLRSKVCPLCRKEVFEPRNVEI